MTIITEGAITAIPAGGGVRAGTGAIPLARIMPDVAGVDPAIATVMTGRVRIMEIMGIMTGGISTVIAAATITDFLRLGAVLLLPGTFALVWATPQPVMVSF